MRISAATGSSLALAFALAMTFTGLAGVCAPALARPRLTLVEHSFGHRHNGRSDALLVECEAVLDTPGTYFVLCTMVPDTVPDPDIDTSDPTGEPRSGFTRQSETGDVVVHTDSLGRVRFAVTFPGDPLNRFDHDGPWGFVAEFWPVAGTARPPGPLATCGMTLVLPTRAWRRDDFARTLLNWSWYHAPPAGERGPQNAESALINGYDLVVATVCAEDSAGTIAHPPHSHLRIDERLWGRRTPNALLLHHGELPAPFASWSSRTIVCGNRSRAEIEAERRYRATPVLAPPMGSRWIMAVGPDQPANWVSDSWLRWPYSDSLREVFRREVRHWPAAAREVAHLLRIRARLLERQRRASIEREAATARAREAAGAAWLKRERSAAGRADVAALARISTDIVVGELSLERYPSARLARLHVDEWLRCAGDTAGVHSLALLITAREDSAARRWNQRPAGGSTTAAARKRSIRCIAFLRFAHAPVPCFAPDSAFRLADPIAGLVLETPTTLSRTRGALKKIGTAPIAPREGCGASLGEFAHLTDVQVTTTALKLSRLASRVKLPIVNCTMLVLCGDTARAGELRGPLGPDAFAPCALPDAHYGFDYIGSGSTIAPAANFRALLDSLALAAPLFEDHVDPADTLSLTLRRVVNGHERVFECTLNAERALALTRILAHAFPALDPHLTGYGLSPREYNARSNLVDWTTSVDRHFNRVWDSDGNGSR